MTTITVQEYEQVSFDANFRSILDLLDLLKNFDLTKITELVKAITAVTEAKTLFDRVKASLQVLTIIAEITPTDTDDRIVDMIKSVLTDELLEIITRLVGGLLGGGAQVQDITILAVDRTVAAKAGIPWSFLTRLAIQILQILERLGLSENQGLTAEATA